MKTKESDNFLKRFIPEIIYDSLKQSGNSPESVLKICWQMGSDEEKVNGTEVKPDHWTSQVYIALKKVKELQR